MSLLFYNIHIFVSNNIDDRFNEWVNGLKENMSSEAWKAAKIGE